MNEKLRAHGLELLLLVAGARCELLCVLELLANVLEVLWSGMQAVGSVQWDLLFDNELSIKNQ